MRSTRSGRFPMIARTLCALAILMGASGGGVLYAQEGNGVGAFSRIGFNARGLALGNALVADSSADVSPYYNPALLPSASQQRVSATAALLAYDRQLQSLEFTTPLGPTAGVGVGLLHAGVTGIDGRNSDGVHTETLSTDEFALSLSFGNRILERLSAGVSLTLYQSDVVPDASPVRGFGVDLGVVYQLSSRLRLAGRVSDLLAKYEWETGSVNGQSRVDHFPVRVHVGGSYVLQNGRLRLLAEFESRTVQRYRQVVDRIITTSAGPRRELRTETFRLHSLQGRVGAAYRPMDILTLRTGLDHIGWGGTSGLQPSAGFGLRQTVGELDVRISYAAVLEPYVRTLMNVGTIEIYL
ncbi:PorV/PorQ family protein [Salinibacter sp. 10B]|uniref:PorV/PorQ family protein n=1 Tax=Salinibacter sp. 10B TaxID=1923971 RepID=UPI0011B029E1|nr:PorV/PorQ family protein [Salinibacter sp. 10B]